MTARATRHTLRGDHERRKAEWMSITGTRWAANMRLFRISYPMVIMEGVLGVIAHPATFPATRPATDPPRERAGPLPR